MWEEGEVWENGEDHKRKHKFFFSLITPHSPHSPHSPSPHLPISPSPHLPITPHSPHSLIYPLTFKKHPFVFRLR
ncbi:hypothetical protein [Fortiea contorta]|uniref:hypothetical protein n=1 Tax=Fortiea contorta TaxID=1892405 RepID=UPI0014614B30|nr:hypothetical protein [Fortiea contorta]